MKFALRPLKRSGSLDTTCYNVMKFHILAAVCMYISYGSHNKQ
jgi:hypothetical protein